MLILALFLLLGVLVLWKAAAAAPEIPTERRVVITSGEDCDSPLSPK